mgnify:FL=1
MIFPSAFHRRGDSLWAYAFFVSFVGGFMPQNRAFIRITITATTAIDTQKRSF